MWGSKQPNPRYVRSYEINDNGEREGYYLKKDLR